MSAAGAPVCGTVLATLQTDALCNLTFPGLGIVTLTLVTVVFLSWAGSGVVLEAVSECSESHHCNTTAQCDMRVRAPPKP